MAVGILFCSLVISIMSTHTLGILDTRPNVMIIPSGNIVKYVNEELNLTCRFDSNSSTNYKINWDLPMSEGSRVTHQQSVTEVMVSIRPLQEGDSGSYACTVIGNGVSERKVIFVKVKSAKPSCSMKMFPCSRGICIPQRYVCDGFIDCPGAKDESVEFCGPDPCKGKIRCDDSRCVSAEKCCDPPSKPTNCPSLYLLPPCCSNYYSLEGSDNLSSSGSVPFGSSSPASPQYSDINFIQSTIYTIVSCAIAFIFITLIMIVAICRIHMKRSAMSLHPPTSLHASSSPSLNTRRRLLFFLWPFCRLATHHNNRGQTPLQHCRHRSRTPRWGTEDEDLASSESLCGSTNLHPYPCTISSTGSFVVMYNSANGVRLIERLPKPPPYSETSSTISPNPSANLVLAPSEMWGPPPAYCSVENINRPYQDEHRPSQVPHVSSLL